MNQLLIVNSSAALNGGAAAPIDLSKMVKGSIGFAELGGTAWLAAKPTKPFMIALGNGEGQVPFIIPEVPVNFKVTKAAPNAGTHFKATVTAQALKAGQQASVTIVLAGKHFNERTNFTAVVAATPQADKAAADVANEIAKTFTNQIVEQTLNLTVEQTLTRKVPMNDAAVTFEDTNTYQDYNIVGENVTIDITTHGLKPTGDFANIKELAAFSRAGKGFRYVSDKEPYDLYPGEPEATENVKYNIYTLEFAVGRASGKQVDETVKQIVRIAVPTTSKAISSLETILGLAAAAGAGA